MVLFCLRLVRGFQKIWPDCPFFLRLLASPADAGETPTPQKKEPSRAPFTVNKYLLFRQEHTALPAVQSRTLLSNNRKLSCPRLPICRPRLESIRPRPHGEGKSRLWQRSQ